MMVSVPGLIAGARPGTDQQSLGVELALKWMLLRQLHHGGLNPAVIAEFVIDLPPHAHLLTGRIEHHARIQRAHHLGLQIRLRIELARLGHLHGLLRVVPSGLRRDLLDVAHHLRERIQIGLHHDLADLSVGIAAGGASDERTSVRVSPTSAVLLLRLTPPSAAPMPPGIRPAIAPPMLVPPELRLRLAMSGTST